MNHSKSIITKNSIFWNIITLLGGTYVYAVLLAVTLLVKEPLLFFQMLLGFAITLGITVLIRMLYFKPRPQPLQHHNFIQKINASSFPSWHASRMVFLTLLFHAHFQRGLILLLLSFLAILVFYSRIFLKKHDWNDITGGVFIGIIAYGITTILPFSLV